MAGWNWGSMTPWGSPLLGVVKEPEPAPQAAPAAQLSPLKNLAYQYGDEDPTPGTERSGEKTGARARQTSVEPQHGVPHDEKAPLSDYQAAKRGHDLYDLIGDVSFATSIPDPTFLSSLVRAGNKVYDTAVNLPMTNKAFGERRGLGRDPITGKPPISGQPPTSALKDWLQWDFLFGAPFEQMSETAYMKNQAWNDYAPEVFGHEGVDQSGGNAPSPGPTGGGWDNPGLAPEMEDYTDPFGGGGGWGMI